MRGMTTDASTVRLSTSRMAVHQCHRHMGRHATTINVPTRERTSTSTPMMTLRLSSGGRRRTLPLWPCYCAAARRRRPPRSDEYTNN
jgi:hypothetical protein